MCRPAAARYPTRRFLIRRFAYITAAAFVAIIALFPSPSKAEGPKHSPRFVIVERLQHGLAGTPLAPYAFAIERSARRWNVSPFLIAAISDVEASWGRAACGFNAWGIASCTGYNFRSWPEGIEAEARLLRTGFLDHGASSPWGIGPSYCPPCGSRWGDQVAFVMRSSFAAGPSVTYPG